MQQGKPGLSTFVAGGMLGEDRYDSMAGLMLKVRKKSRATKTESSSSVKGRDQLGDTLESIAGSIQAFAQESAAKEQCSKAKADAVKLSMLSDVRMNLHKLKQMIRDADESEQAELQEEYDFYAKKRKDLLHSD